MKTDLADVTGLQECFLSSLLPMVLTSIPDIENSDKVDSTLTSQPSDPEFNSWPGWKWESWQLFAST